MSESVRHTCHAFRCQTACPPKMLMCRKHWYMVPRGIQHEVWATYREGQEIDKNPSPEWMRAADKALIAVALKEGHIDPAKVQSAQALRDAAALPVTTQVEQLRFDLTSERAAETADLLARAAQRPMPELYGLSLHRPWPWAFVGPAEHQQKRVENRTWRPRPEVKWLALHAAKQWDEDGAEYIRERLGLTLPPEPRHPSGQIFAVCQLTGVFEVLGPTDIPESLMADDRVEPWAFGPWCWLVGNLVPLIHPVPCSGARGLWKVSERTDRPGLLEDVRAAYIETMKARKSAS